MIDSVLTCGDGGGVVVGLVGREVMATTVVIVMDCGGGNGRGGGG